MGRWVPVNDAAVALGVSVATLKRHLKSGKVQGRQEQSPSGFRWFVELPEEPDGASDTAQPASPTQANETRDQVVELLQQQVKELWAEVAARRQEVRELHILLQQAQAQIPIPAMAARPQLEGQHIAVAEDDPALATATPAATSETPVALPRRWWQFWR